MQRNTVEVNYIALTLLLIPWASGAEGITKICIDFNFWFSCAFLFH